MHPTAVARVWRAPRTGPGAKVYAAGGPRQTVDEEARARQRRDDARWYIVAGVGMMFAGSFSVYFAMGGVVMAVYGGVAYGYWSRRMRGAYDAWKDEELDAWERENL